jgi:hypothetical protein
VFLAALALAWLAFGSKLISPWWLLAPAVSFVILVVLYDKATRGLGRASRLVAHYERGLARLEDRWAGTGEQGTRFLDPHHPFSADLDLFGPGSLFELLCLARTRDGEATLAGWLLDPAAPDEIRDRQEAVMELRGRLDLREDLAILGADVRAVVDPAGLAKWGQAPLVFGAHWPRYVAFFLPILALAALAGWLLFDLGQSPLMIVLILEVVLFMRLRREVSHVLGPLDRKLEHLAILAGLLGRLEREQFTAPRLADIHRALASEGEPASRRIARLDRLIDLLNWQRNQFFAPLAALLLWTIHVAYALENWRRHSGRDIERWLRAAGEFEALLSLANYAFENPSNPLPVVVDGETVFQGTELGHPLIPRRRCVCNDVKLGGEPRVLIVSGSNMSGKSTLLRTVGINVVLALAGAPVRAVSLRLSPLSVGATLRIQDSLQAGQSRFYAEITRIRQLVDLSRRPPPLLFLLDEILHGTNSHDRRLGAEAVVRELVQAGAIGLLTTHDLALAHIAELEGATVANVHFEDHLEDGHLAFDYKMRPGVVQKSNALELMRAVGLDV